MGVVAIVCVLMIKFAALASVDGTRLWAGVLLMPLAGRCAIVVNMALLPYARPEGLGKIFCRRRAVLPAIWALAVLAGAGYAVLEWQGLVIAAACVAAAALAAAYFYRKIGGCTGDTFGAVCELTELVPAVILALWHVPPARWLA